MSMELKGKVIEVMDNWVGAVGYESFYQVSDMGRVRSIARGVELSQQKNSRTGYVSVKLKSINPKTRYSVHRIVAMAFIPNPLNKPTVNHINGDKTDNRVENLEWATYSENNKHLYQAGLRIAGKRGQSTFKKLILDMQTGIFYDCIKDAADAIGMSYQSLKCRMNPKLIGYQNNTNLIYA
jgi:hypothetical protein